ncbi:MAG TPA: hypothetical protein VGM91_23435 [Conexibacter sp.]
MTTSPWLALRGDLAAHAATGASPDVILGGPKPDPNYVTEYGKAFNATGDFDGTNYVYARARNAGKQLAVGTVTAYAARLSDLPNQADWVKLQTRADGSDTPISAKPGAVAVNGVPLIWEPQGAPAPSVPWCLIAEVTGDDDPPIKVPSTVTDKAGFDAWIAQQTRIAYLIVQESHVAPPALPSFSWSRKIDLENSDDTTLAAAVTCTDGPAGGVLAFSFDTPDKAGQPIGLGTTQYRLGTSYSQTRTVPAGFESTITITFTPPSDATVDAVFTVGVQTISGDGDDGDMGSDVTTLVAGYTLRLGQTLAS